MVKAITDAILNKKQSVDGLCVTNARTSLR